MNFVDALMERVETPKSTAPHARAELVAQFVDRLNLTIKPPYRPATFKQVNGQLRHYTNHDLYVFLKKCEQAKNFGAFFWFSVKKSRLSPLPVA